LLDFSGTAGKFVRFDGLGKIVDDEEKNADIAAATASIFDEVSGDFSAQKPVKLNRLGYTTYPVSFIDCCCDHGYSANDDISFSCCI